MRQAAQGVVQCVVAHGPWSENRDTMTTYYVTECLVDRDCAHFFLGVSPACLGSRAEGSMTGTTLELSDRSLQNLLYDYEEFRHLVDITLL